MDMCVFPCTLTAAIVFRVADCAHPVVQTNSRSAHRLIVAHRFDFPMLISQILNKVVPVWERAYRFGASVSMIDVACRRVAKMHPSRYTD